MYRSAMSVCPLIDSGLYKERATDKRRSSGIHAKPRLRSSNMPLYMYQAAYTAESWAAQMKKPQNRVESVGRQVTEAVGGKMIGGWYCLGDYDAILIADVPNIESMAAIAVAIAAGGAIKSSHTTALMTGAELVAAL